MPSMLEPRASPSVAAVDNRIYVFGGDQISEVSYISLFHSSPQRPFQALKKSFIFKIKSLKSIPFDFPSTYNAIACLFLLSLFYFLFLAIRNQSTVSSTQAFDIFDYFFAAFPT